METIDRDFTQMQRVRGRDLISLRPAAISDANSLTILLRPPCDELTRGGGLGDDHRSSIRDRRHSYDDRRSSRTSKSSHSRLSKPYAMGSGIGTCNLFRRLVCISRGAAAVEDQPARARHEPSGCPALMLGCRSAMLSDQARLHLRPTWAFAQAAARWHSRLARRGCAVISPPSRFSDKWKTGRG